FGFGALPAGGPVAAQPSRLVSNGVVSPVANVTSATNAPSPCTDQSLAYAIEISTCLPAYAPRSIDHCSHPLDRPLAAFQTPVVPVGVHAPVPSNVLQWSRHGWSSRQPAGQLARSGSFGPVLWLVCPF